MHKIADFVFDVGGGWRQAGATMNARATIFPIAIGFLMTAAALPAAETSATAADKPAAEKPATDKPAADAALDFGNFSSETLTGKAWTAFNAKDYAKTKGYAQKCIDMYKDKAVEMQKGLTAPATVKEEVFKSWALNDVGTCYYLLGMALDAEKKSKEAIAAFKFLADNLAYAQCWDTKGWFWKPADAAREKVKALEFDALK